ncbi:MULTISPECIES: bifunctional serine/threonine protein kinase/MFS transporter [unclassified Streptomyces]|uniref:bifunctional serine/threonine protein kinase/MFS transporter n=1 Tax=unclassified Streptomyces TaxID=2593676 RepID=UPI0003A49337|nr:MULTISPECIES: bifunctional serine/threonine protein kinase/MFS transporter [unclassified Streptomyces]MYQ77533.1 MFS transporter [Streptomyces sp. SID4923]
MKPLTAEDPTRIGPYRLIARLGAGGMGLVYLGRSDVGRTVAVKVVQREYAAQPEFRRRFAREVAAARRVGGSWTADVLDADTGAEVPWVATQYVPGPDLTTVVGADYGPLPEHSVRVLANRLALALEAVHGAGLIHRDLKPSNVLVTVDGPRVIDFGIARAMDNLADGSLLTRTGMLIGSPGFMSPEQVRGLELTPASDVFCLGAVLVYAATGRLLFGARDTGLNAHLFRIAEDEPDLTDVPESLLPLVRACLAKDPAARPTPEEIAARTSGDGGGGGSAVWLPGEVLAELGRRSARLLDYVPEAREPMPAAPDRGAPADASAVTEPVASPAYPPTTPAQPPGASRTRGLAVIVVAQLAVLAGAVLGNPAGPHGGMTAYPTSAPVSYAFAVAFAAMLVPGGHIADRLGRRRSLITGAAGFAVSGVLSGLGLLAGATPLLLAGRALQGGFGALATAGALATVAAGSRGGGGRGFGAYAAASACGPVLGLLGSDALAFMARGPLTAVAPALALLALTGARTLPPDSPARTDGAAADLPGALLGFLGAGAAMYALVGVPSADEVSSDAVVGLGVGVALLLVFAVRQRAASAPLLPPYILRDRARRGGLLTMGLVGFGVLSLLPPLADMMGDEFSHSAPWKGPMLPMLVAVAVSGGRLAPRLLRDGMTPARMAVTGLPTTAAGVALGILAIESDSGYAALSACLIVAGIGIGLTLTALFTAALTDATPRYSGATAGALMTAQSLSATLGTGLYTLLNGPPWWAALCMLLAAVTAGRMLRTAGGGRV